MTDDIDPTEDAPEPTSLEDANDNPDEVEDDGLGDTEPEPFDPKDVDEVDK